MRWVALLRGVNVGGHNRLAMSDLRATIGSLGSEWKRSVGSTPAAAFARFQ